MCDERHRCATTSSTIAKLSTKSTPDEHNPEVAGSANSPKPIEGSNRHSRPHAAGRNKAILSGTVSTSAVVRGHPPSPQPGNPR